jgi:hypothetical protein
VFLRGKTRKLKSIDFFLAFGVYSRMEDKKCQKCFKIKDLCLFKRDSRIKNGIASICKECDNILSRNYQKKNIEKVLIRNKKWINENKDRIKSRRISNSAVLNERRRLKYLKDENHREKLKEASRLRRQNPKHRQKILAKQRERRKEKLKSDPYFRMVMNLRRRFLLTLHGRYKEAPTRALVGCSWEELRRHLESKFRDGMTWENYGKFWHVDHISPCKSFDLSVKENQHKCCHFSNLQPLLRLENLRKGGKELTNAPIAATLSKSELITE